MEAFAALADPTRRGILELLAVGERSAGEIAGHFRISRPAVSRHLRVLREAGLATAREEAQRRMYRIEPAPLAELDAWLERFRPLPERRAPERAVPDRSGPSVPPRLANRLDALDTEIRRGRRRRTDEKGDIRDDRSAG